MSLRKREQDNEKKNAEQPNAPAQTIYDRTELPPAESILSLASPNSACFSDRAITGDRSRLRNSITQRRLCLDGKVPRGGRHLFNYANYLFFLFVAPFFGVYQILVTFPSFFGCDFPLHASLTHFVDGFWVALPLEKLPTMTQTGDLFRSVSRQFFVDE